MKIFLALIASASILSFIACNKDKVEQKATEKANDKKEPVTQQKSTENKEVSNVASGTKLYKIESVEKQSGKNVVPNFTWTEDGKKMSMNELKGNVVLVNLWATWCGPCVREMPDLSKISEELKDKNFRMLGLNIFQQERAKKVEDFLKTNPVSYTILDGNNAVVDAFGEASGSKIEAVPTTFIIDKNGKIAETIVGGRDKETFLKAIDKYLN